MNLDSINGQDLTGVFKISNLSVSGLLVLGGLSQLFHGFHSFLTGLFIIIFGAVIAALEFKVPAEAYAYASFLFSFIGRGIFYIFLGINLSGGSVFRILAAIIIVLIGLVYIALETIPSISPPDNMNPDGAMIGLNDEEAV